MKTVTKISKKNTNDAVDYFSAKLKFETTPHTLKHDMENNGVFLLDVRDRDSFNGEHIVGATNIPMSEFPQNYKNLPKDKTIVTYCWNITCALAPKAALELAEKGFAVQELSGGIEEWKKKGFPVEGK